MHAAIKAPWWYKGQRSKKVFGIRRKLKRDPELVDLTTNEGHSSKTYDQRLSCRSCKGNHPTDMHGYIPKDKLKRDESTGQTEDKKIANSYADVIVATTQENSDT